MGRQRLHKQKPREWEECEKEKGETNMSVEVPRKADTKNEIRSGRGS